MVSTNKQIVKNTLMLYIRMMVSVCVNLYASRVLLRLLGVVDFGIYSLVGGIIALMAFLNTSMSGATSRFLAYELGQGNSESLSKTFKSSLQSHILIALIIFVIGETLGLWFVNNHLTIPFERQTAANFLYQFSLFISIVSFLQVPFSATVIAHERFDVYSFVEICNVIMKLGAVFILSIIKFDKLIMYPILLLIIALVILISYIVYCKYNFSEVNFNTQIDKNFLLPMLTFSGWDIYGNGCVVVGQQGSNILMNRFFGVTINAAIGVANQASSAVLMFVSNITMALRPPIIKLYASHSIKEMQNLLVLAIVICLGLAELICVPLCLRIHTLMSIWLNNVPEHATDFCWWMLIVNGISVVNPLLVSVIHATGKIKQISVITGTLYLFSLLFTCLAYFVYNDPVVTYKLSVITSISVILSNLYIIKHYIPEISLLYLFKSVSIPAMLLTITIVLSIFISRIIPESFFGFVILFLINALILVFMLSVLWFFPKYGWGLLLKKRS